MSNFAVKTFTVVTAAGVMTFVLAVPVVAKSRAISNNYTAISQVISGQLLQQSSTASKHLPRGSYSLAGYLAKYLQVDLEHADALAASPEDLQNYLNTHDISEQDVYNYIYQQLQQDLAQNGGAQTAVVEQLLASLRQRLATS